METRKCLFCESVIHGRSDKKFCDDNCRSCHYKEHHRLDDYLKKVNATLMRNRKILEKFVNEMNHSDLSIPLSSLMLHGFNMSFHTGTVKLGKETGYCCYDYTYLHKKDNSICIYAKKNNEI